MSMNRFTVEEENLIAIYLTDTRAELVEDMTAALPYMDAEMRKLADRTLAKLRAMSDAEFAEQTFDFTDDNDGE